MNFLKKVSIFGLGGLVAMSMFAFNPNYAFAVDQIEPTAVDIRSQIDSLLGQISNLQTQIDPLLWQIRDLQIQLASIEESDDTNVAVCSFTRNLTVGARGDDVTCLQNYLKFQPFANWPASQAVTGYFGPITKAAVANWQKANNISPSAGYFGPISRLTYFYPHFIEDWSADRAVNP